MPLATVSAIAGMPAIVAGILIMRLGRSTASQMRRAAAIVPAVSFAKRGDTSRLTNPSDPARASKVGRSWSAASRISATATCSKTASGSIPEARRPGTSGYASPTAMAFSKMVGFDVTPPRPRRTRRANSPERRISRLMVSSQMLCPAARSLRSASGTGFAPPAP